MPTNQLVVARDARTEHRDRDSRHGEHDPRDVPSSHPLAEETTCGDEHERGLKGTDYGHVNDAGEFDSAVEQRHVAGEKDAAEPSRAHDSPGQSTTRHVHDDREQRSAQPEPVKGQYQPRGERECREDAAEPPQNSSQGRGAETNRLTSSAGVNTWSYRSRHTLSILRQSPLDLLVHLLARDDVDAELTAGRTEVAERVASRVGDQLETSLDLRICLGDKVIPWNLSGSVISTETSSTENEGSTRF